MPAPSLGLTSGISAGGDRLREMVTQQIAREIAAAKYAEELRQKRHAEMVAEGKLGVDEFDADTRRGEADTRRGTAAQQLAEWKWKLENPEMAEHRGIVDPTNGRPVVELRRKYGTGPGVRLGEQYEKPEYMELNDQIRTGKGGGVVTRIIDPRKPQNPVYESPQYVRPVTGSGSGDGNEDVAGIARMVMGNPDLLKEMNPTARTAVLREIAKNPEPFRMGRQRLLDSILGETEAAIVALQKHPGMRGAVGAPSPFTDPGSITRLAGLPAMPGSSSAGFEQESARLQSLLTAPRLDLMRGLGAMSEREFAAMQASASKLSGRINEPEYKAELDRLLKVTRDARARAFGGQAGPTNPTDAPGYDPTDPAGLGLGRR